MQLQKSANPGAPALIDPAGPTVSLETSEAMFDIGVALNACGYDKGLDESEPVRKVVRGEVNQATQASAAAQDDRDKLCLFIDQHRLDDPARNLAQYVSLALYLTPPPQLTPSVEEQDMPPDANAIELILPLLRRFADAINLHLIWVENHAAYEEATSRLHGPLTSMIVSTNYYIKTAASTYSGRRFLVVLEPMLSPEETNARVYGLDYVVVASPKNGQISMDLVRHAYLHYEIEPLLYARENTVDERMLPILKAVQDAPLDYEFKNDIEALVIECMIRAIEARTMDTGVAEVKVPPNLPHSEVGQYEHARSVAMQKEEVIRQQAVNHSMAQGYVLTQYFYTQLKNFEKNPESLNEAIGPMVYGMDISIETHRARETTFDAQRRRPRDEPFSAAACAGEGPGRGGAEADEGRCGGRGGAGAESAGEPQRRCRTGELYPGARGPDEGEDRRRAGSVQRYADRFKGSADAGVVAHLSGADSRRGGAARGRARGVQGRADGARWPAGYERGGGGWVEAAIHAAASGAGSGWRRQGRRASAGAPARHLRRLPRTSPIRSKRGALQ